MFHPVGSRPPSVYWRRRLSVLGAVVVVLVLVVLTVRTVTGGGGSAPATPGASNTLPLTSAPVTPQRSTTSSAPPARPSTSRGTSAALAVCALSALKVVAVVGKPTYTAGAMPVVGMQVTNTGSRSCVRNLADSEIELRVYNGASRVWGSHDCAIAPGTKKRTLAVGRPYLSTVLWGGLSSEPGCKGTRARIGAGKYTLYALLAGKQGAPAQFTVN